MGTTLTPQEAVALLRQRGTVSQKGSAYTVNLLHGGGKRTLSEAELIEMAETEQAKQTATTPTTDLLPLDRIRTDGGTQARAGLHEETVEEYAAAWDDLARAQNGFLQMPPLVVFYDGTDYWLADGFHRLEAYRRFLEHTITASARALHCTVQSGTRRDAVLYAACANANHGLRRTNADKRRAVEMLLRDEEWQQWSDREIGRRCQVHHELVGSVRRELGLTGGIRQSSDGRTMDTSGISRANTARAKQPDADLSAMRARFLALGYEQFYVSDKGYTAYCPLRGATHYKDWDAVEAAIVRLEAKERERKEAAAFADAQQRFAALGWRLERHGLWFKLTKPDGEHYATTEEIAPQLNTLRIFEEGARKRATEGAINNPDGSPMLDSDLVVGQRTDPHRPDPKEPPAPRCLDCGTADGVTPPPSGLGAHLCEPCREKRGVPTTRGLSDAAIAAGWTLYMNCGQWYARNGKQCLGGFRPPYSEEAHRQAVEAAEARLAAVRMCEECKEREAVGYENIGGVMTWTCPDCHRANVAAQRIDDPRARTSAVPAEAPLAIRPFEEESAEAENRDVRPPAIVEDWRADVFDATRQLDLIAMNAKRLRAEALRAAADLVITLAGDAARLALSQAEKAAQLLEADGYASIAALLRLLAPPAASPEMAVVDVSPAVGSPLLLAIREGLSGVNRWIKTWQGAPPALAALAEQRERLMQLGAELAVLVEDPRVLDADYDALSHALGEAEQALDELAERSARELEAQVEA